MNKKRRRSYIRNYLLVIMVAPFFALAQQQNTGIQFESGKSWNDILAKAKAESKFIFLDCYATWCGPCKTMREEIFPRQRVGDYFNTHFISVAVQMDKTSKDAQDVREWYVDAAGIREKYQVNDYPTFLFFSPEGNPVHREVGSIRDEDEFINVGKNAINPANQYYSLIGQYKYHSGETPYLLHALTMAINVSDHEQAVAIANYYIESLKDSAITKENIQLIYRNRLIASSTDKTFLLFLNNASKIDSIMEDRSYSERALSAVIFQEQISPFYAKEVTQLRWKEISAQLKQAYPTISNILIDLEEVEFRNGIKHEIKEVVYKDSIHYIDWAKIHWRVKLRYPDYDFSQVFLDVKAGYCYQKEQWETCEKTAYDLMHKYGKWISDYTINNIAWEYVFMHGTNRKILKEALKWMKRSVERAPRRDENLDTYANLLYKTGSRDEALIWEKKAIDNSSDQKDLDSFKVNLNKMEKMQPTWAGNGM